MRMDPEAKITATIGAVRRTAVPRLTMIVGPRDLLDLGIPRLQEDLTSRLLREINEKAMKINWTTDSAGSVLGFSYHDAILTGLEWAESSYFRMRLSQPHGTTTIELTDLDTLTLQVWNGAIISDIFVWPVGAVPETVWNMGDGAWHVLLSGRVRSSDERLAAAQIIERRPTALLIHVLTSYGGTIVAVCENIDVSVETRT